MLKNKYRSCLCVSGEEEDKVQLPFTVSDLKGRNLQLVTGQYTGPVCICGQLNQGFFPIFLNGKSSHICMFYLFH